MLATPATVSRTETTTTNQMHKSGHAFYGTQCPDGCSNADRWAAQRLITPRAFLQAARAELTIAGTAEMLGATPSIVTAYIDSLSTKDRVTMNLLVGHRLV